MKGFYVLLAAVALGGGGWLVYSARHGSEGPPHLGGSGPAVPATDNFRGFTDE